MSIKHCSQTEFYHSHMFLENERRMGKVAMLTCLMMVAEILGGTCFSSMALLADGFHMATHVGALSISVFAYAFARRHMHDPRYSFGTGKVGDLAGFTSAIILMLIAISVLFESSARLIAPVPIIYGEAIIVAVLGLAVNGWSVYILHNSDGHDRHHDDHSEHYDHHHDNNFRSAYLHVVADAVTSILAITALACGWIFGWRWMDPAVGIIGAFVILSWAWSLIRATSAVLLDQAPHTNISESIHKILKAEGAEITDLHLWRVAPGSHIAIIAVAVKRAVTPQDVREWLKPLRLVHMTVEINHVA